MGMNKSGRIQKKYEIDWRNKSHEFFSTSPDSPVHAGASAIKPTPVVRANPMFHHLEGLGMDDDDVVVSSLVSRGQTQRPVYTELTGQGLETMLEPKRGQISGSGEPQYHPTAEKLRVKKNRHRRSGSFGSTNLTPRDSPIWERKATVRGEDCKSQKLCEAETQTDSEHPIVGLEPLASPASCARNFTSDLTIRSRQTTPRTPSMTRTPRHSLSIASLNGNTYLNSPGVSCDCPGCPGNPLTFPDPLFDDENSNIANIDQEDYLDTLDRKVNEIMNRDCSTRSSQQDLTNKGDMDIYGPLSFSYGRKKTLSDLNCNPTTYSPRVTKVPAPEGSICFEDDGKESSSEAIESSQEDLSQVWSEDEDHYVLRRRSLLRRPIRAKNRNSLMSMRSIST